MVGVVNSVVANSAQASRLRIFALAPAGLERPFRKYLKCHGLTPAKALTNDEVEEDAGDAAIGGGAQLRVRGFSSGRVPPLRVRTKLTNLESPLNFARFYLHELLPRGATKV